MVTAKGRLPAILGAILVFLGGQKGFGFWPGIGPCSGLVGCRQDAPVAGQRKFKALGSVTGS